MAFSITEGVLEKYTGEDFKVIVPEGVTVIGPRAFEWCTQLEEIVLPDSLRKISLLSFNKCSSLKRLIIPEGVRTMGYCALDWCESLESLAILGNTKVKCLLPKSIRVLAVSKECGIDEKIFRELPNLEILGIVDGDNRTVVKREEWEKQSSKKRK